LDFEILNTLCLTAGDLSRLFSKEIGENNKRNKHVTYVIDLRI
jgi:hypothetical protein